MVGGGGNERAEGRIHHTLALTYTYTHTLTIATATIPICACLNLNVDEFCTRKTIQTTHNSKDRHKLLPKFRCDFRHGTWINTSVSYNLNKFYFQIQIWIFKLIHYNQDSIIISFEMNASEQMFFSLAKLQNFFVEYVDKEKKLGDRLYFFFDWQTCVFHSKKRCTFEIKKHPRLKIEAALGINKKNPQTTAAAAVATAQTHTAKSYRLAFHKRKVQWNEAWSQIQQQQK